MKKKDHKKPAPQPCPRVDIEHQTPHADEWRVDIKDLKRPTREWRVDVRDIKPDAHEWRVDFGRYTPLFMFSGWGLIIGCVSLLFLYIGHRLDQWFGTAPTFMLGLLFLALVLCIGRLYHEAWRRRKDF